MNYVQIGFTQKPHGTGGELKVKIFDEYIEDFLTIETVFLEMKGQKVPWFVENIRGSQDIIVKFEDVEHREKAASIASKELYLRESDILAQQERTIPQEVTPYGHLAGFSLWDAEKGLLGVIEEVQQLPGQEMAILEYESKAIMVPLIPAFILSIDAANQKVVVSLPEGLLDL